MSNWEGHKDLLCALSILALSKPIVHIRSTKTWTRPDGFGDRYATTNTMLLLLKTRIGVAPTSSGFADHPLTVWVPRQKCSGSDRIWTCKTPSSGNRLFSRQLSSPMLSTSKNYLAGEGVRTLYIRLGRPELYQMSYTCNFILTKWNLKGLVANLWTHWESN